MTNALMACTAQVLFLEGLRVCVMPLAERIGEAFPQRFALLPTLSLMYGLRSRCAVHTWLHCRFVLGVLVTYAEPSISALRPLGELIDPST
jgi:hypothetical protein